MGEGVNGEGGEGGGREEKPLFYPKLLELVVYFRFVGMNPMERRAKEALDPHTQFFLQRVVLPANYSISVLMLFLYSISL